MSDNIFDKDLKVVDLLKNNDINLLNLKNEI